MKKYYCLAGLLFIIGLVSGKQALAFDLTKVNFNYLYNDDPIKIDYQIAQQDSIYRLILSFYGTTTLSSERLEGIELYQQKYIYSTEESYVEPIRVSRDLNAVNTTMVLDFYTQPSNSYLVVRFSFFKKKYLYGIEINEALSFPLAQFIYQTDASTTFYNGLTTADSVWMYPLTESLKNYVVYECAGHFMSASPPMVVDEIGLEPLRFDTLTTFDQGIRLRQANSFYFIQQDRTSRRGKTLFCHPDYYPKIKEVDELVEPMIYLSTQGEYEEMMHAENRKAAFDAFWLKHTPHHLAASKAIKQYFRAIKLANAFFTGYKKGWKTDRGMVYVIFGAPEKVTKKTNEEVWEYTQTDGTLILNFTKVPNLFIQQEYSLVRKKILNKAWFQAIKKWRTGDL